MCLTGGPVSCDAATGMCAAVTDGTTCDDLDSATVNDVCMGGF